MSDYTTQQLSQMVDALTQQVAALDGQGLPTGAYGVTQTLSREVRGMTTTLSQYALVVQSQIDDLKSALAVVQTALSSITTSKGSNAGVVLQVNNANGSSQTLLNLQNSASVNFTDVGNGNIVATINPQATTAGGNNGQLQWNNQGAFAGVLNSGIDVNGVLSIEDLVVPNVSITSTLKDSEASVGVNGQILTSTGSAVVWVTPPSLSIASTNVDRPLLITDGLLLCTPGSGEVTITLPDATTLLSKVYYIKKADTDVGIVNIITINSQTIDILPNYQLLNKNQFVQVVSDGSNWQVIGAN